MCKSIHRFCGYYVLIVCLVLLVPTLLFPRGKIGIPKRMATPAVNLTSFSLLDVGNWGFWARSDGMTAHDPYSGSAGGYFPITVAPTTLLYSDGFIWGAILRNPETNEAVSDTPRVGGIMYRSGLSPGWISAGGPPVDLTNNRIGVYRIRSDWRSLTDADLIKECTYLFHVNAAAVTKEMMASVRQQYEYNWKNWPVDLGAPYVDVNGNGIYDPVLDSLGCPDATRGDYPGLAQANQVIWFPVNDLNKNKTLYFAGSLPIGLEVHFTLWTYKGRYNPLRNVVFKRIEIYNKSNFKLDSMYISVFSDPDIGDYSNDLVGCDSLNSIAFAYNGTNYDEDFSKYHIKPAAVVYDLLQGPTVSSSNHQDTAIVDFQYLFGHKNLKMTSFQAYRPYIEEPPMGDIYLTLILYNIMRGFQATPDLMHPTPQIFLSGPRKGQTTRFPLSGNPVTDPNARYGDIDGEGGNYAPGDRSFLMSTGPFVMEPGSKQDIIVAIIGGLGKDYLNSLQEAWNTDVIVKRIYKNLFKSVPNPPAKPMVRATPLEDKIVLNWGFNEQRVKETEEVKNGDYVFEGYNVYQLPTQNAKISDEGVKRIATLDRIDGVQSIYGTFISPKYGNQLITAPIQYGTDSGVRHYYLVNWDSLKNRPLYRGSTYYFAVTAYNYNPHSRKNPSIESEPSVVTVTVQGPKPGDRYEAEPEQEIKVQAENENNLECRVFVIDPAAVTGHKYEIFFETDRDTLSATYGQMVWNLKDVTKNRLVLEKEKIHYINDPMHYDAVGVPIVDGLKIFIYQPPNNKIQAIVEVANGNGPLEENDWDDAGRPFHGNNVWHSLSAPSDVNRFYLSAGGGSGNLERIERSIENARGHDFEMRFTAQGGLLDWVYNDWRTYAHVPFEMWDVGFGTYDDYSDDERLITVAFSPDSIIGQFGFHTKDPALGYPATDWIYARRPKNAKGSYANYVNALQNGLDNSQWFDNSEEVLAHLIICDFDGARTLPETGTVIRFITVKGPQSNTKFYFKAPGRIENDKALARKDVEKINVFPNPYYGSSEQEPNRFTHFVTFNHLPRHAIVRIFTLNGMMVRKLEKNDDSPFFRWDLRNRRGFPVASGLYIVHIEMPDLKKTKILKLMVIGTEEVPEMF